MKCLYVGYDFSEGKIGANVVRKNNHSQLNNINELEIDNFFIKNDQNKLQLLKNVLRLSFNGGNQEVIEMFRKKITNGNYEIVFFDGSLFGRLVRHVKNKYPSIKIVTYFHNIEVNYYKAKVKVEGIINLTVLPSIMFNERLSIKYSDKIIVLNQRDKSYLDKKISNNKVSIIPISLKDQFDTQRPIKSSSYSYLFIGSDFYANIHGICWFIENVLPFIDGKLLVIGRGMEVLNKKYSTSKKLNVIGTVDDISRYYYEENIVISPIFYGSGMKTKTIEAFMYGKTIVGTDEAFVGVNTNLLDDRFICNSKDDFIKNLADKKLLNLKEVTNKDSRNLFLNNFSSIILEKKFKKLFI